MDKTVMKLNSTITSIYVLTFDVTVVTRIWSN